MRVLVTGVAGFIGSHLAERLLKSGYEVLGIDSFFDYYPRHIKESNLEGFKGESGFEFIEGDISTLDLDGIIESVEAVFHQAALAGVRASWGQRFGEYVSNNVLCTQLLLEASKDKNLEKFVYASSSSVYGDARDLPITESSPTLPVSPYGVTKLAAEDLCALFHRNQGLPCIVLRTSRFFPEEDDNRARREAFADANAKANEFLFRRVDIEDAVSAHLLAVERAAAIGFGRYVISATTPFDCAEMAELRTDPAAVVRRHVPGYDAEYVRRGWAMFPEIDRVYVNRLAREDLGWRPVYDFERIVAQLAADEPIGSGLARQIGIKGYHAETFADGPYPVE